MNCLYYKCIISFSLSSQQMWPWAYQPLLSYNCSILMQIMLFALSLYSMFQLQEGKLFFYASSELQSQCIWHSSVATKDWIEASFPVTRAITEVCLNREENGLLIYSLLFWNFIISVASLFFPHPHRHTDTDITHSHTHTLTYTHTWTDFLLSLSFLWIVLLVLCYIKSKAGI